MELENEPRPSDGTGTLEVCCEVLPTKGPPDFTGSHSLHSRVVFPRNRREIYALFCFVSRNFVPVERTRRNLRLKTQRRGEVQVIQAYRLCGQSFYEI